MGFFDLFRRKGGQSEASRDEGAATGDVTSEGLDVGRILDDIADDVLSGRMQERADQEAGRLRAEGLDPDCFVRRAVRDEYTCAACREADSRVVSFDDPDCIRLMPPSELCRHGQFVEERTVEQWLEETTEDRERYASEKARILAVPAERRTEADSSFLELIEDETGYPQGCRCRAAHPLLAAGGEIAP